MKSKILYILSATLWLSTQTVNAQLGEPYIHDPSTIAACDAEDLSLMTVGIGVI